MADRRSFLGAVSGVATTLLLAGTAEAQSTAPPAPAPSASAVPPPSAAARAIAASMRRFDPALTDAEVETIARGVDQNPTGAVLNPHRATALRNADEPVLRFSVRVPQ